MEKINLNLYNNLQWIMGKGDLARIKVILEFVGHDKKILDIGCYDGHISEAIKRADNDVYGLEGAGNAVEIARKRGIKTFKLNIESDEFPFSKEEFDVVVAAEIIEHIYDTDTFLEKINNVLKSQGFLVLTTPNLAALGRRLMLLCGLNPFIEISCKKSAIGGIKKFYTSGTENQPAGGHIRYFVKENLVELIEQHGFKVEKIKSDIINFNKSEILSSIKLAKIFPGLGKSIIIKAKKCS